MAESAISISTKLLKKAQSNPAFEYFDVNSVTGNVYQACMNVAVDNTGTAREYSASECIPSNAKKTWVDGGFLDLNGSYLPINFRNGAGNCNWCWYQNGKVFIGSNTWNGTAYVILKYIV